MMDIQTVTIGGRVVWVVRNGEQVVVTVFEEDGEYAAMPEPEGLFCDPTLYGAMAGALSMTEYPATRWPAQVRAAFENKVATMATHPDDWEQW